MRTIYYIQKTDPKAHIEISFLDQVLDNIRDLQRYVLRDRKTSNASQEMLQIS